VRRFAARGNLRLIGAPEVAGIQVRRKNKKSSACKLNRKTHWI
jgi:hypothetical protein